MSSINDRPERGSIHLTESSLIIVGPPPVCFVWRYNLKDWIWSSGGIVEGGPPQPMDHLMVEWLFSTYLQPRKWTGGRPGVLTLTSSPTQAVALTLTDDEYSVLEVLWEHKEKPVAQAHVLVGEMDEFDPYSAKAFVDAMDRRAVPVYANGPPHPAQIQYSVNTYDADGDCAEKGVFLWFGNTRVCVAENPQDFVDHMADCMAKMAKEIAENYNLRTGRPK